MRVKDVGRYLYLDSSTLTPLFKRLEEKGYVARRRSAADERDLIVSITDAGTALREKALTIPQRLAACVDMEPEKAQILYGILYELLGRLGGR